MTRDEYLYLENVLGTRFGDINAQQAEAVKRLAAGNTDGARDAVLAASALTSRAGEAFAMIARAMRAALAPDSSVDKPTTGLRPGQVVADVGGGGDEPKWEGTIDPNRPDITPTDWRLFHQNYERMAMAKIFSSSPAGKARNADGSNMHQGDLAQPVINVAEYKASGGIFAPWL